MLDALILHFSTRRPLASVLLHEAAALSNRLCNIAGNEQLARLSELAVQWVLANPQPISMTQPDYSR
ncbi:hypothetical protein [Paenibacillus polymyxa]|uniref:hypothetical protein n=1 Tax=Paenibacillus polymyxa TaxID=1406 RepID=UPI0025B6B049|nr:hypothetical protein [Paenibacillus polymyxa]MDN4106145.1 hypothetical protein [Paenibacillus polymyxa]